MNNSFYIARLKKISETASTKDRKLADFILRNREKLDSLSLYSIAEKCDASYATVCRFLKKLGFSGIKECRSVLAFSGDNLTKSGDDGADIEFKAEIPKSGSYTEIKERVCDFSASIVEGCKKFIDDNVIDRLAELIISAESIHFVGLGTSSVTARYGYTKFFRINPGCSFDEDIIISKMRASLLKKGCLLIAISSSGRTKSICDCAKAAKEAGATVISICDFINSPLVNLSDISICTTLRDSNKYLNLDFPLIHGQITLIDILYACVYNKAQRQSAEMFAQTANTVLPDKI